MQEITSRRHMLGTFNAAATANAEFNATILQFATANKTPLFFIGE
jgi:hypothetical protein